MRNPCVLEVLAFIWLTTSSASGQTLSGSVLDLVRARMNDSSTQSWEAGTRAETLLELDYPSISVFSSTYLSPTPPYSTATLSPVINIALTAVDNRAQDQLGGVDGSAGDPASLGVAVLLANFTNAGGGNWVSAAQDQLDLLLTGTPRSPQGAISHRTSDVELWSDFIYMVPPFFAYYGAVTSNATLISDAYTQISLYRDALFDGNVSLWRHISNNGTGGTHDNGHWSTGNGWAAAGMLRVLAIIKNSPFASQFQNQQNDLSNWITEIHSGMSNHLSSSSSSGMLGNYPDDPSSFADASGTALFASTVYRHVLLNNPSGYSKIVSAAESARKALYADNGQTHFDASGWLMPVCNPNEFGVQGSQSPEAQSFVLQLNNNWQQWSAAGGKSAGRRSRGGVAVGGMVVAASLCAVALWLV